MRGWLLLGLLGCGRHGFDEVGGANAVDARRPDGNVCVTQTADRPNWPMPNDRPGLPHPASYTTAGGRVIDNVTGLEWQRALAPASYTWSEAVAYCAGLDLDGGCWRLPERIELTTIINYSVHTPASAPDFEDTPSGELWTNTVRDGDPMERWVVNFVVGYMIDGLVDQPRYVRCVRGAQATGPRFQIGTTSVLDLDTGLEWQGTVGSDHMWAAAQDYCSTFAGGGWRSPSIQELHTLVDTTVTSGPRIDLAAFPDTPGSLFWSGNEIQNDASQGWTIDFSSGYSVRPLTTALPTRCVR